MRALGSEYLRSCLLTNFHSSKSWVSDLSFEVSLVSVWATGAGGNIFLEMIIVWGNCEKDIISKIYAKLFSNVIHDLA